MCEILKILYIEIQNQKLQPLVFFFSENNKRKNYTVHVGKLIHLKIKCIKSVVSHFSSNLNHIKTLIFSNRMKSSQMQTIRNLI